MPSMFHRILLAVILVLFGVSIFFAVGGFVADLTPHSSFFSSPLWGVCLRLWVWCAILCAIPALQCYLGKKWKTWISTQAAKRPEAAEVRTTWQLRLISALINSGHIRNGENANYHFSGHLIAKGKWDVPIHHISDPILAQVAQARFPNPALARAFTNLLHDSQPMTALTSHQLLAFHPNQPILSPPGFVDP